MDSEEISRELSSLARLDTDAVHAYDAAIANVDALELRRELVRFRGDHDRHARELRGVIRRFGGEAPSASLDFKGFVLEGFTAVRSATGTEGALKAMKASEALASRAYSRALALDLPADVKALVQSALGDELRHLRTIEQGLVSRAWEEEGTTP